MGFLKPPGTLCGSRKGKHRTLLSATLSCLETCVQKFMRDRAERLFASSNITTMTAKKNKKSTTSHTRTKVETSGRDKRVGRRVVEEERIDGGWLLDQGGSGDGERRRVA